MLTIVIEPMASSGSPSQLMRELMMWSFQKSQLKTLNVGSNIHFHASVESTVGMMNGSRMKARIHALPRKWRVGGKAGQKPPARLVEQGRLPLKEGVSGGGGEGE